jgi:hypothetical protein
MNSPTATAEALQVAFRKFSASISPEMKQSMNGRPERGLQIALSGGVTQLGNANQFLVPSSDTDKPPYFVDLNARSCTCPDHWNGHTCKHRLAAQIIRLSGVPVPQQPPEASPSPTSTSPRSSNQAIIWACVRQDGKVIGVEVLSIEDELVRVQALPIVKAGGKLEPQFPFPEGQCSLLVPVSELEHIRIYQDA